MPMFWFSIYPDDKHEELEKEANAAGYPLTKHPEGDNLCVLGDSRESVGPLWSRLERIAPGIKLHGPM